MTVEGWFCNVFNALFRGLYLENRADPPAQSIYVSRKSKLWWTSMRKAPWISLSSANFSTISWSTTESFFSQVEILIAECNSERRDFPGPRVMPLSFFKILFLESSLSWKLIHKMLAECWREGHKCYHHKCLVPMRGACKEQGMCFCCSPRKLEKSMLHSRLLISTKLIRLQGLWQLIRQLVNLVNDSVFPKAANTLFLRKDISSTCYSTFFFSAHLSY